MFKTSLQFKLLLTLLLFGFVTVSHAKPPKEISLADASEIVRNKTNGKILSARTSRVNGQNLHKIQVLTQSGRVKIYRVPAQKNRDRHARSKPNNKFWSNDTPYNRFRSNQNNLKPKFQPRSENYSKRSTVPKSTTYSKNNPKDK